MKYHSITKILYHKVNYLFIEKFVQINRVYFPFLPVLTVNRNFKLIWEILITSVILKLFVHLSGCILQPVLVWELWWTHERRHTLKINSNSRVQRRPETYLHPWQGQSSKELISITYIGLKSIPELDDRAETILC